MKKILSILAAAAFCLVSCTSYDEIAMWNKNEDLGERVSRLEELCEQMNSNISALQLIVEALQDNDYVTGIVPVTENGETIGYTINFSKSGPVTIYHGKDGEKGDDGKTPVIGVKKDTDGLYYWTLDGEWLTDDEGKRIPAQGRDGKSAYELAVEKGYTGTLEQWLESLNGSDGATGSDGKSAYELAVEMGYTGTLEEWLESLKGNTGADGKSAYELAVEMGYTGTLAEWLASLNGGDGNDGKSAYELAVEMGYTGTLEQWLESLKGESGNNGNDGDDGQKGDDGITPQLKIDEDGYWCVSYDNGQTWDRLGYAIGDDGSSGQTGADGKSAYELAVENGFTGTLDEWLESLKGSDGTNGDSMFEDVIYNDGDAYITLILAGSGEQIKIPVYTEGFTFELKQSAVTYTVGGSDDVFVEYELNAPDPTAVAIECISHSPYKFSAAGGKITVSLPDAKADEAEDGTEVLVFASDDKTTLMRKITVKTLIANGTPAHLHTVMDGKWSPPNYDNEAKKFAGCRYIKANTGQRFCFPGVTVDILYSPADVYPDFIYELNSAATITFHLTVEESETRREFRYLFIADNIEQGSDRIAEMYRENLKSDVVQAGHHGAGGSQALYEYCDADIALWPTSQARLEGGSWWKDWPQAVWLRENVKVNIAHGGGTCTMWFEGDEIAWQQDPPM